MGPLDSDMIFSSSVPSSVPKSKLEDGLKSNKKVGIKRYLKWFILCQIRPSMVANVDVSVSYLTDCLIKRTHPRLWLLMSVRIEASKICAQSGSIEWRELLRQELPWLLP